MILIFGGAYQGKLDFAKKKFGVTDRQVFTVQKTSRQIRRRKSSAIWSRLFFIW